LCDSQQVLCADRKLFALGECISLEDRFHGALFIFLIDVLKFTEKFLERFDVDNDDFYLRAQYQLKYFVLWAE
jgi:hypothetical protein